MTVAMTPAQFAQVMSALASSHATIVPTSDTTGSIWSKDVTVLYNYNGTDTLNIEVLEKNSFKARMASESQIETAIKSLLAHTT